jgi:hypothetical protein
MAANEEQRTKTERKENPMKVTMNLKAGIGSATGGAGSGKV